jgi:beta-N-acetylhexosaminidase
MARAGSFFVLGFEGLEAPASLKRLAERHDLGGTILFARNIVGAAQLRRLNEELHALESRRPPLTSVDQEGGRVRRLRPPDFGDYEAPREVEAAGALEFGRRMGRELRDLGFDLDYAPVLDVDTNPDNPIIGDRSFGRDPETVARAGVAFLRGLQENGVLGCGKHFPGHGDTSTDSHLTLPYVDHGRERLEDIEIAPFGRLIRAGLRMLMSAHVVYRALDPDRPATFSHPILRELLRGELGYEGVVITDDMGMAGATSFGDLAESCTEAFAAGCDLLMICHHHERHEEAIAYLEEAFRKSSALQSRAEESYKRLLALRGSGEEEWRSIRRA